MIDSKWRNNELYNLINSQIDDKELVDNIFNCILPHMLEQYGENGVTIRNLLLVMPSKLYKYCITGSMSYYTDVVHIICAYKVMNSCETGFPLKRYEDLFNTNIKYENALAQKRLVREQHRVLALKKQLDKKKRKQVLIKNEDFDKTKLITIDNIINHIKQQYGDVEFLEPNQISIFAKDLHNYRVGSLVYNNPFRIKSIGDMSIYWVGMCDCGNFRVAQGGRINDYQSCSKCAQPEHIYIGEKHGHLECIDQQYLLNGKHNSSLKLKCKCDCGSTIIISPVEFNDRKQNCGKKCKYSIERRNEINKEQGAHFKPMFFNDTNVGKLGRTNSNSNSSTGYLGVTFVQSTGKYLAYITFQHKQEMLGTYNTPEEAYKVRLAAQNMLHTQFLHELDENEFVQHNKFLVRLLDKVKNAVQNNIENMPK